jgi:hypothetical protein
MLRTVSAIKNLLLEGALWRERYAGLALPDSSGSIRPARQKQRRPIESNPLRLEDETRVPARGWLRPPLCRPGS